MVIKNKLKRITALGIAALIAIPAQPIFASETSEDDTTIKEITPLDLPVVEEIENEADIAATGWQTVGNQTFYYYSDGTKATGVSDIGSFRYWFDSQGVLRSGWTSLYGYSLYFDPETQTAETGVHNIGRKAYYFNLGGVKMDYSGLQELDDELYYFDSEDHTLISGWQEINGDTYYFDPNTFEAATGLTEIDGVYYTFDSDGVYQENAVTKIYLTDPEDGNEYLVESTILTDPQIGVDVTEDEFFTAAVYCEGGGESYGVQVAIAMVMLNRMEQSGSPSTIKFTIYKSDQFAVARDGSLTRALTAFKEDDQSYLYYVESAQTAAAVAEAKSLMAAHKLAGADRNITSLPMPDGKTDFDCLFFMTPAAFARLGLDETACEAFTRDGTTFFTNWSYG